MNMRQIASGVAGRGVRKTVSASGRAPLTMVSVAALLLSGAVARAEPVGEPDNVCEGGAYVWTGANGAGWADPANWSGTDPEGDPVGGFPGTTKFDCAFIRVTGPAAPAISGAPDLFFDSVYVASKGSDGELSIVDGRVTVRTREGSDSGGHIVLGRGGGSGTLTIGDGGGAPHVETEQIEVQRPGDLLRIHSGVVDVTDVAFLLGGTTEILGSGQLRAAELELGSDATLTVDSNGPDAGIVAGELESAGTFSIRNGLVEVTGGTFVVEGTTEIIGNGQLATGWLDVSEDASVIVDTQAPGAAIAADEIWNEGNLLVQGGLVDVSGATILEGGATAILDQGQLRTQTLEVAAQAELTVDTQGAGAAIEAEELLSDGNIVVQGGLVDIEREAFLLRGTTQIIGNGELRTAWLEVDDGANVIVDTGNAETGIVAGDFVISGSQGTFEIRSGILSASDPDEHYPYIEDRKVVVGGGDEQAILRSSPTSADADKGRGGLNIGGTGAVEVLRNGTLEVGDVILDDTASLIFNGGQNGKAFAASISGTGSVALRQGALTLSGANTYTGLTRIDGALTLAGKGTLGAGTVALNGTLRFDRDEPLVFANAISGSGAIVHSRGNTTFTAANAYTGGTRIDGTVTLAGKGTLGTGAVAIDGTLRFNRDEPLIFANSVSGAGKIVHSKGNTTFTGNGTYSGTAVIDAGTVTFQGSLPQASVELNNGLLRANGRLSRVTVNAGGILQGAASAPDQVNIGTLVVNGGTVQPGNSPGTLRVGSYTQAGGSIVFERGDLIEVVGGVNGNGKAVLSKGADGSPIVITLTEGVENYVYGTTYTFVTAEGGVSFSSPDAVVVQETPRLFTRFETAAVGVDGQFYLVRDQSLAAQQSLNPTQQGVARVLEASLSGGPAGGSAVYNRIISAREDQLPAVSLALSQLTGEVHASLQGRLIEDGRHVRDAVVARTRGALSDAPTGQSVQATSGGNLAIWGQVYGSKGHLGTTAGTGSLSHTNGGFILGGDARISDNWRAGIAGGYSQSDVKLDSLLSSAKVDNYNLALYAGAQWGPVGLRFGAANTWHRISTSRDLNVADLGLFDLRRADYDARTLQLFAEAGYAIALDPVTVEPFVNLAYVDYRSDSFRERDMGLGSALWSRSSSQRTGFSTLGLRVSTDVKTETARAKVSGTLGWRYAFGDVQPGNTFSFNTPATFYTGGAPIQRNALVAGVEAEADITDVTSIAVSYTGQFGRRAFDHGIKAALSVKLN